jgi:phosphoribosylaminoimidazole carboxylase PurE protein
MLDKGSKNMNEEANMARVGVVMGSDSDLDVMRGALAVLAEFEIPFEVRVLSAHRTPKQASDYAQQAASRGLKVLIAGAGWAAHLAGSLAASTTLPVIGVPIDSSPLQGMDALLSTVQMPPGVPVATMAVGSGGARNAALFAVEILALEDRDLATQLGIYKEEMARKVEEKDRALLESLD